MRTVKTAFSLVLFMMLAWVVPASAVQTGVDWSSASNGTLDGVGYTFITGAATQNILGTSDFASGTFAALPLSATQEALLIDTFGISGNQWTLAFSTPYPAGTEWYFYLSGIAASDYTFATPGGSFTVVSVADNGGVSFPTPSILRTTLSSTDIILKFTFTSSVAAFLLGDNVGSPPHSYDATFAVDVAPPNNPPTAVDDNYVTPFETALNVSDPGVLTNDSDPDGDGIFVVGGDVVTANGGSTNIEDSQAGDFIYFPPQGFSGVDSFTYTIEDDFGATDTATVFITVNNPPTAVDDNYVTPFETLLNVSDPGVLTNDSDPDGDGIFVVGGDVVTANGGSTNIEDSQAGDFIYFPPQGFSGVDSFTYIIEDDFGATDTATVFITVEAPNSPPTATAELYSNVCNDSPFVVAAPGVLADESDPDGDPITAILVSGPSSGSVVLNSDGSFTYTPVPGFVGNTFFVYKTNDGQVDSANFAAGVLAVITCNTPPVTVDDAYNTPKNTPLIVAAPGVLSNDSDPDGDPLQAFPSSNPSNGVAVLATDGSFTYTPNAGFAGQDSFTYVANDGTVNGNIATITIDVINTPPVTVDDAYEVIQGQVLNVAAPGVLVNDSDPDGDPLQAFPSSNPSNGVAVLATDGSFTYTPNAGFAGLDSFTYVANDFTVNGNIATVSITVKDSAGLIADAQALLDDLLAGGDLSQKNYDKLDKTLGKITDKLGDGDNVAACNHADAALSQTADMLAAGDITQQVHDDIAAALNAIKLSIPC